MGHRLPRPAAKPHSPSSLRVPHDRLANPRWLSRPRYPVTSRSSTELMFWLSSLLSRGNPGASMPTFLTLRSCGGSVNVRTSALPNSVIHVARRSVKESNAREMRETLSPFHRSVVAPARVCDSSLAQPANTRLCVRWPIRFIPWNDRRAAPLRVWIARRGPDTACFLAISVPLRQKSRLAGGDTVHAVRTSRN
jgi:hypothetical protein